MMSNPPNEQQQQYPWHPSINASALVKNLSFPHLSEKGDAGGSCFPHPQLLSMEAWLNFSDILAGKKLNERFPLNSFTNKVLTKFPVRSQQQMEKSTIQICNHHHGSGIQTETGKSSNNQSLFPIIKKPYLNNCFPIIQQRVAFGADNASNGYDDGVDEKNAMATVITMTQSAHALYRNDDLCGFAAFDNELNGGYKRTLNLNAATAVDDDDVDRYTRGVGEQKEIEHQQAENFNDAFGQQQQQPQAACHYDDHNDDDNHDAMDVSKNNNEICEQSKALETMSVAAAAAAESAYGQHHNELNMTKAAQKERQSICLVGEQTIDRATITAATALPLTIASNHQQLAEEHSDARESSSSPEQVEGNYYYYHYYVANANVKSSVRDSQPSLVTNPPQQQQEQPEVETRARNLDIETFKSAVRGLLKGGANDCDDLLKQLLVDVELIDLLDDVIDWLAAPSINTGNLQLLTSSPAATATHTSRDESSSVEMTLTKVSEDSETTTYALPPPSPPLLHIDHHQILDDNNNNVSSSSPTNTIEIDNNIEIMKYEMKPSRLEQQQQQPAVTLPSISPTGRIRDEPRLTSRIRETPSLGEIKRNSSSRSEVDIDVESVLPERTRLRRQRRMRSQESVEEKPEEVIERLNKLKARISGALNEVKGVLKQYSTESEAEAPPVSPALAAPPPTSVDNKANLTAPVQFRFVKKVRRRSCFDEEEEEQEEKKEPPPAEKKEMEDKTKVGNEKTLAAEKKEVEDKTKVGNDKTLAAEKKEVVDKTKVGNEKKEVEDKTKALNDKTLAAEKKEVVDKTKVGNEKKEVVDKTLAAEKKEVEDKTIVVNEKKEAVNKTIVVNEKKEAVNKTKVGNEKTLAPEKKEVENKAIVENEKKEVVDKTKVGNDKTLAKLQFLEKVQSELVKKPKSIDKKAEEEPKEVPTDITTNKTGEVSRKQETIAVQSIDASPIEQQKVKDVILEESVTTQSNENDDSVPAAIPKVKANKKKIVVKTKNHRRASIAAVEGSKIEPPVQGTLPLEVLAGRRPSDSETIVKRKKKEQQLLAGQVQGTSGNKKHIEVKQNDATASNKITTKTTTTAETAPKTKTTTTTTDEQLHDLTSKVSEVAAKCEATAVPSIAKSGGDSGSDVNKEDTTSFAPTELPIDGDGIAAATPPIVVNRTQASDRNRRISLGQAELVGGETVLVVPSASGSSSSVFNTSSITSSTLSGSKELINQAEIIPADKQATSAATPTVAVASHQQVAINADIVAVGVVESVVPQIAATLSDALVDKSTTSQQQQHQQKQLEHKQQPTAEATKVNAHNDPARSVAAMPELKVQTGPVQPVKIETVDATEQEEQQPHDAFPSQKKKVTTHHIKKLVRRNSIDNKIAADQRAAAKEKEDAIRLTNILKDKNKINDLTTTLGGSKPTIPPIPKKLMKQPKPKEEEEEKDELKIVITTPTIDPTEQQQQAQPQQIEPTSQLEINEEKLEVEVEAEVKPKPVKAPRKIKKKVIIRRQKRRLSIGDTSSFFIQPEPEETKEPEIETIEKAIAYVTDDEASADDDNDEEKPLVPPAPLKSCIHQREYKIGDLVLYAERYRKTQVRWKRGRVLERITSISYKLDIEGKEVSAHISYIKKNTGRKVRFGAKEYLEIDYEQVAEEERRARSYSIWNMV